MTTPTDRFTDFATRTQQLATAAVRTWADTVQSVAGGVRGRPTSPDVHVVVDRYFDFAQQVLDQQRHLARSVVTAGTKAAETVTEQTARAAESVTAHATNAAESVHGATKDVGHAAGEQGAAKGATRS